MADPRHSPPPELVERSAELDDDELLRRREIEEAMGESYEQLTRTTRVKRALFAFLYDARTELAILFLIVVSVALLIAEVAAPQRGPVGWLGGLSAGEVTGWFFWVDVALSLIFAAEYGLKLWLAPKKWYFVRHNWIDLLAILPILRIMRVGRALRLLRLFRLLRLMRLGPLIAQRLESISAELHARTAENVVIFIYLLFSLVFGTVGILVFEKGHDSGYQTLGDGLWWCIVTLTTVGYGDKFPVTTGGRFVATMVMFIGLSFYALLTGVLSSMLIDRSRREEGKGMDVLGLRDHIVVCGWNPNATRLVSDLRASDRNAHVVIVVNRDDVPRVLDPNVYYVRADPSTSDGMDKGRIDEARVAVIVADDSGGRSEQDVDARSVLTALAVERRNPRAHTIVELLNEDNVFHLENAGVDEIIISGAYTGTMLSQAVQFPGISDVFGDLFATGAGSQLVESELPVDLEGVAFSEASAELFRRGLGVLVGYRRGRSLDISPAADIELAGGDLVILMRRLAR